MARPRGRHQAVLMAALACLAGLGACTTPTAFEPPTLPVPKAFVQADAITPAQADAQATRHLTPWWKELHDPQLNAMIEQLLAQNLSLGQAALSIRQAQLTAQQAGVNELPSVTAQAQTAYSQPLRGGSVSKSSALTAGVSWEVNLWGRLAALRSAAEWEAKATQEDREATAQSLVATATNLYFELGYLNERVALSEQTVANARKTLALTQAQHASGTASGLDLAQAQQTLNSDEAAHTQYLLQRVQARNALAVLFDHAPDQALTEAKALPSGEPPVVPAGLPSQVLVRRPDIRAAELRLRETLAQADATRDSYYPALSLTGTAGGSTSTALGEVLDHPFKTLGAQMALPFLQWGDMQRSLAISKAEYESAVLGYRQTWYNALADVYNALGSRTQYGQQVDRLGQALAQAQRAQDLTQAQYEAGTVALSSVLQAQESTRQARAAWILARYNLYGSVVTLYEALGGSVHADAATAG